MADVSFQRAAQLRALQATGDAPLDVLVIGGGITGAGVALDAASRGLRVAVIDARDFASGTSSRSSKLIHGGLRYLESRDFALVVEGLRERATLLRNAPHLVHPLRFAIPLYDSTPLTADRAMRYVPVELQRRAFRLGLIVYDLLGSWRLGRHREVSPDSIIALLPSLSASGLQGGFVYSDAQTDDARLVLSLIRTAALDHHAITVNYIRATSLTHDDSGRVSGVVAADMLDDSKSFNIHAAVVVNATGVWAEGLRSDSTRPTTITPAKGVHLTLKRADLPVDCAAVLTVPEDGRHIFVIPDGDYVYVGTTDTPYEGDLDEPSVTQDDLHYVLGVLNAWSARHYTEADVTGLWSGVRPLVTRRANSDPTKSTADLSRRHAVEKDEDCLISVYGGKLTAYRSMAADTMAVVIDELRNRQQRARPADRLQLSRRSSTRSLRLRGAVGMEGLSGPDVARALGIAPETLRHLVSRYGSEARVLLAMIKRQPELAAQTDPDLPYLDGEFIYAARYEMCTSIADALTRRTRAILLNTGASVRCAPRVAQLLAAELKWTETQVADQLTAYFELATQLWSGVVPQVDFR
jgi:glycerol-3-phosphate dehydrogenase